MFIITHRNLFLIIAALVAAGSLMIIAVFGLRFGIDFTGGALTEVVYENRPDKQMVEMALDALALGGYSLRETTDETGRAGYLLRTRDLLETERVSVSDAITTVGDGGEVIRFTSIGPVIGQELRDKAVWAIGAVVIIIILYVAFAFSGVSYPVGSWRYGGITILALAHDILVPTAAMALFGYFAGAEVDVLFVMAILAVLGYSVNDTIVVFDRVRENLIKYRQEKKVIVKADVGLKHEEIHYTLTKPFREIVGLSVQETMMRSLNTSFTTLLALSALYIFGGAVTQTFALVLIIGVVAGTYSSVCIANPLLVLLGERALAKKEQSVNAD